jgi:signal transduction histidine kinase
MKSMTPASATPVSALVALSAGFAVAGVAAGGAALLAAQLGGGLAGALLAGAGVALLAGVVVALALLLRLRELGRALAALGRGEPAALSARGWPLGAIPAQLAAASARMAEVVERERRAGAYREELTRQVGEAAAREERNRLARELHDSIKQQLFSIDVSAAAARARAGAGSDAEMSALDDIQAGARAAQAEMTALLQQLRPAPLENVGLVEALRDQATALGYRSCAEVTVSVGELPPAGELPPRAQEELFRMAQEALANVARHARAHHVALRLERAGAALRLEVRDDGQGFDPTTAPGGMGLGNLRARAQALSGTTRITSAPGAGTTVAIEVPLLESPRAMTPEEAARRAAVVAASARSDFWQQWTWNGLRISFLLLLVGLPVWVVALGMAVCAATYTLWRLAGSELARLAGAESDAAIAQRRDGQEALVWLLIGLALLIWYLPVAPPPGWAPGLSVGLAAVICAGSLALALWIWERWRRLAARALASLGAVERREAIESRWRETLGWWALIGVIVALGLIFGGWAPAIPPRTATQWSDTASIALLALLVLFNGLETWLLWRWRARFSANRVQGGEAA